ncbi:LytTR family DNA-binding domain-containing protein [Dyadobacter chenwenxiniae]|uniref:LytTR family DNA-binding domain-containing protein n=1 Tax=Dyadobacter chenwenxiniae TaxID=2906456 RepID=A0A9X1PFZ4_9BACT|nr:LytTR family DNA-binding domain-containing protein [Dyadobacter chenwenxiniae]MCF0060467.1 LytTR family DNA-binding domain-containing protein [Dyadobacter chenwenxiniae]UON86199.1 LytTR family DNA-binding domain-containing protein [Dyadobacter chenwenxiniae]
MNVVIIEDEARTARQLERMLRKYDPNIKLSATLPSVKEAVSWFNESPLPDLVFMDIHLEDGLAFRIFEQISLTVPIVFTTAYDEYMLKAFKVNSIDYLLKPVDYDELAASIEKFRNLRPEQPNMNSLFRLIEARQSASYRERFMITIGHKIWSIDVSNVAYFFSEEKATTLVTIDDKHYPVEYSLDQLLTMVDPNHFFRINRQFLVSRRAIQHIHVYSVGRLKVDLIQSPKQDVFVSMSRLSEFKDWLGR